MRKPIIKNWIKYCSGTLAVSGLLLLGSCGSGEEQDTDLTNEVEAVESDPVVLERDNVANEDLTEELGEEVDTDADDLQTAGNETDPEYVADESSEEVAARDGQASQNTGEYSAVEGVPTDRVAYTIDNMDAHLEQHEDVNQRITQELTDNDQTLEGSEEVYNSDGNNQLYNQGRENVSNTDVDRNEQEAVLLELYTIDLDKYAEEDRQRVNEIMNEYKERRERERGVMNPETNAYISPEVDARPEEGYDQLMENIGEIMEYPEQAEKIGMEGTVIVNFVVNENGDVIQGKAVEYIQVPLDAQLDLGRVDRNLYTEEEIEEAKTQMMKEAVKAVTATSGQWEAAMQNGETVPAELQLPVRFRITDTGAIETN